MESFLSAMVLFINQLRENPNSPAIKETGGRLAEEYFILKQKKIDYMSYLEREFAEDAELFILILSVLFFLFHEEEILEKVEEVVQWDTLSYDTTVGIVKQVIMSRFNNYKLRTTYQAQRMLQRHMTARLKKELNTSFSRIPYQERVHNRIVLSTDTLLSDDHAPTQFVLKIARALQGFGYEVRILVSVEKMDREAIENCWIYPYHPHYMSKWNGEFERSWEHCILKGYQHIVDTAHFEQARHTLERLAQWKPECVWHIGGQSSFAEVLGEITTLACMPCTASLAISDAPVFVGYFEESAYDQNDVAYAVRQGQRRIRMHLGSNEAASGRLFSKRDFGMEESAFAIALVGNRLDTEIDTDFINVMQEIVKREPTTCFVLVGKTERIWETGCLKGHIKCLGFQKDLVDVLEAMDLFLNPPRQGAAGGAVCALAAAIPILTLPACDVAGAVGQAFICEHLEEIPEQVSRYIHDERYYHEQAEQCKRLHRERLRLYQTISEEYRGVITQIGKWLQDGVIL